MDAKDELMTLLGIDLQPGDKLRRINLPEGWPGQVLTIIEARLDKHEPVLEVLAEPAIGQAYQFTIFAKHIGVLYERIGSSGHEQTSKNHFDPARTERGKRRQKRLC